ncbi:HdeD family acid-resistance protein [Murimonas intestini]|uniref:Uncharacterized membrane protein HdeD (DUF308 family) n=1 Tax=Murimonas intestini TaxID=1337051 RepID=A0AB73TAQ6_9FIRM|nr:DUF308 domain-containing protein [Murimonas intestini]MCR1838998.1 DUF308 domain-containing protein [Murimonas intestini]MCR1864294.1 DUF308 domain-containing protein [Murimonas intestini]MCR1881904.1 DUF308 domain-containing protein [Murimonas intestini]
MRKRSAFGWLELIIGIIMVFLGVFIFVRPETALTGIVILYGIIAVVMGITDIMFYVKMERYTGFGPAVSLISGIFSVMAGIMLLVYPSAGKWILVLLLPIWFIAHCISRLSHLSIIRIMAGSFFYYFTLIMNIIGIIVGCMMIINPVISLFTAGFLIGIYFILSGIDSIVMAVSKIGLR